MIINWMLKIKAADTWLSVLGMGQAPQLPIMQLDSVTQSFCPQHLYNRLSCYLVKCHVTFLVHLLHGCYRVTSWKHLIDGFSGISSPQLHSLLLKGDNETHQLIKTNWKPKWNSHGARGLPNPTHTNFFYPAFSQFIPEHLNVGCALWSPVKCWGPPLKSYVSLVIVFRTYWIIQSIYFLSCFSPWPQDYYRLQILSQH